MTESGERTTDPRFYAIRDAAYCDPEEAERLVAADPSIVHVRNSIGETPLTFLAVENSIEAVKWLLEHGADTNAPEYSGGTPLHYAARLGYVQMCRFLLDHGARPELRDQDGDTPLAGAAYAGHLEIVELLLALVPPDADISDWIDVITSQLILDKGGPVAALLEARGLKRPTWE